MPKSPQSRIYPLISQNFLPLFFLVNYSILAVLWRVFSFPSPPRVLELVLSQFNTYGFVILPIASLIESISIFTSYFPGSTIIVLSFLSAEFDWSKIFLFYILFSMGFILGYTVDYILGKYAIQYIQKKLHINRSFTKQKKFQKKYGKLAHFIALASPTIGGLYSVHLGYQKQNFFSFLANTIIGVAFWGLFWTIFSVTLGSALIEHVSNPNSIFGILITWLIVSIIINQSSYTTEEVAA